MIITDDPEAIRRVLLGSKTIAVVGCSNKPDRDSYQIAQAHEGRGLMTEALRASNRFVFEGLRLHRIMANYRPENERSGRLLERLGFAREGVAKDYLFIDGAWRDHVLTALVNPAFDPAWIEAAGQA